MTKHTPRPWKLVKGSVAGVVRLIGAANRFICRLEGMDLEHNAECRANASLITAAPELLGTLKVVTALCKVKYTSLDAGAWQEIEASEKLISEAGTEWRMAREHTKQ